MSRDLSPQFTQFVPVLDKLFKYSYIHLIELKTQTQYKKRLSGRRPLECSKFGWLNMVSDKSRPALKTCLYALYMCLHYTIRLLPSLIVFLLQARSVSNLICVLTTVETMVYEHKISFGLQCLASNFGTIVNDITNLIVMLC